MKPIAILSVDTNPAYLSCIPIVCKSWELQGFNVALSIFVNAEDANKKDLLQSIFRRLPSNTSTTLRQNEIYNKVNTALFAQCYRLYIPFLQDVNAYCILSDADMFIASSFLYRDFDKVNSFGHDLTGYGEIPMCYVGMQANKWREVISGEYPAKLIEDYILRDLIKYTKYQSKDWYECWGSDQQILTAKLQEYGYHKINFINRGKDHLNEKLPLGRWDRYNWVMPTGEIHDVHMMHNPLNDVNFPKVLAMCETVYPNEDWSWLHDYRKEFNEAL